MSKAAKSYVCQECGHRHGKWQGQCTACRAWNSIVEEAGGSREVSAGVSRKGGGWAGSGGLVQLGEVGEGRGEVRLDVGEAELNRVLGGGLVEGSVVLLGGDPGIGKSTLLMQVCGYVGRRGTKVIYATGEESAKQVEGRARRLGVLDGGLPNVYLCGDVEVERLIEHCAKDVGLLVVDSIQTVYTNTVQSAPGSVSQVRESAALLTRMAKLSGVSVLLIGHVTKGGDLAGPRVLEHMVDTVLYFEGETGEDLRMLRAVKNRFGGAFELGVFLMTGEGLEGVSNPSELLVSDRAESVSGAVVLAAMEGGRPLLVEVQCLVEDSTTPNAKRYGMGVDVNRMQMVLACMSKHAKTSFGDLNVYAKTAGGLRVVEPGLDLALMLAAYSSKTRKPWPKGWCAFGEVSLVGDLRGVGGGLERLKECARQGYEGVVFPASLKLRGAQEELDQLKAGGLKLVRCGSVREVLRWLDEY